MMDKQTDRQTEFSIVDSTPSVKGSSKNNCLCGISQGAIPGIWSGKEKTNEERKRGDYLKDEKVMTDKQTNRQAEFSLVDSTPSVKGSSKNRYPCGISQGAIPRTDRP